MDYLDKIFGDKDITESSKKLYCKNILRLHGGTEIKNLSFLKDEKKIMEKLAKYKPNTQRTYIISIVSLLKSASKDDAKVKKMLEKYTKLMDNFNTELKSNTEPNEKEKENWLSEADINARKEELDKEVAGFKKTITEDQFGDLQKLLLLSLYTDQRPRRNLDYQDMVIVKKEVADLPTDKNYLFLDTNRFVFNNFKTKKSKGSQVEAISPTLRKIIDTYIKVFPLAKSLKSKDVLAVPFLVSFKGERYTNNNDMTRIIYKIFDGKKVGSSMFRKMFLTGKYKDVLNELKDDVEKMGTSTDMALLQYVKQSKDNVL